MFRPNITFKLYVDINGKKLDEITRIVNSIFSLSFSE